MEAVWVALIVAVIGPMLLDYMRERRRRQERKEDREDREAVAKRLAKMDTETIGKLEVIHSLVDGSMTAAMNSELGETVRNLALMRDIMVMRKKAGEEISAEDLAAIESAQTKIDDLYTQLSTRERQQELADAAEHKNNKNRSQNGHDRRK